MTFIPRSLAALCLVLAGACGTAPPTSPSEIPIAELQAAPTRIEVDGKLLTLTASLWRDFMPIAPPGGGPLTATLRVQTEDGTAVPAEVTADASYVVLDGKVWSAAVEGRPRAETAPGYEVVARNGPKWGPGVAVDVVVRLRGSAGRAVLLRAPAQMIKATY